MKYITIGVNDNLDKKIKELSDNMNIKKAQVSRFILHSFFKKNNDKKELEELKKIQEETNSNVKQLLGSMPSILDKILEQNLKSGYLIYQLFFKGKPEKLKIFKEDLQEALEKEKEKTIAEIEKLIGELS